MRGALIILFMLISSTVCMSQESSRYGSGFFLPEPAPKPAPKTNDYTLDDFIHGNHGGFYPPVGYRPVITWIPQGTMMNVGPVVVSPDRRYVRMGIGIGFYHIPQVYTFNYRTGEYRRQ